MSLSLNHSLRASILVPAYNEAAVIGGTLRQLTEGMLPGEFEIIVIANNCSDNTAEVAAKAALDALVLETDIPGKTNALRMGLAHANAPVKVFLDADLGVDAQTIRDLIAPLEAGTAKASHGQMDVNLDGCSWPVRAFYSVWFLNPYLENGKFGGLFALNDAGIAEIGELPDLTADDEYISRHFTGADKAYVRDVVFEVRAPRILSDLFKIRRRSLRGTRELDAMGLTPDRPAGLGGGREVLKRALRRPTLWPAIPVYLGMMLSVRIALRLESPTQTHRWEKDMSSRIAYFDG